MKQDGQDLAREQLEALLADYWEHIEQGGPRSIDTYVAAQHLDEPQGARLREALHAMIAASAMLPQADAPQTIGDYTVRRRIGSGAMGEVFEVVHPGKDESPPEPLALKRLLPPIASTRALQRLQREVLVLQQLKHPGIIEIRDVGREHHTSGSPFLVMPFIAGGTMADLLERVRKEGREVFESVLSGEGDSFRRVAQLIGSIAEAVAAAHDAGVLHRDLKPSNVLINERSGAPIVIDFGLASEAAAATLTGTGDLLGTPQYMAPEQARGDPGSEASDVFAIGAMLFELLTLRSPRAGRDPLQVLANASTRPLPVPSTLTPSVPRELDLIARRATAFRREHRYSSARKLAEALRHGAAGGRPTTPTLMIGQRFDECWRRHKRRLVGAASVAVLAGASWFVVGLRQQAKEQLLQSAWIAAFEAHIDGDDAKLTNALGVLSDCEGNDQALVAWLRADHAEDPTAASDFVTDLDRGHGLLATDPKRAIRHLKAAVHRRPDRAIASGWLGMAAAASKQWALAERELTSAVRRLPDSETLRIELGRLLRRMKRPAESLPHLEHAVQLPNASPSAWNELAKACIRAEHRERALEAIEQMLQLSEDPRRRAQTLRMKGIVYDQMGRHEEALPILARVVELAPSTNSRMSYGMVLDKVHRIDEAANLYREVLKNEPDNVHALLNLSYLHAGGKPGCGECHAYFREHPDLLDPTRVDALATRILKTQLGHFALAEEVAGYLKRVGGGRQFRAAAARYLNEDHPAEALGRLMRAVRILDR